MKTIWLKTVKPILLVALFFSIYYFGGNAILLNVIKPAMGKIPERQAEILHPFLELDFGRVLERIFGFFWTLSLFFAFNRIFHKRSPSKTILFTPKHKLRTFLWGSIIGALMISFLIALSILGNSITVKAVHLFPKDVFSTVALYVFCMALTAMSVEIAMRGYILETLKENWGIHLAVWTSALCFSLAYIDYSYYYTYGAFVAGLFLGYAYAWYGIYYCIGWYFIWNLIQSVFYSGNIVLFKVNDPFLAGNKAFSPDEEGFLVLPVLLIGFALMLAFHKSEWRLSNKT